MPLIRCGGGSSSASGSIININTGDDGLFGQSVTLSDGGSTLTGTFSDAGKCTFKNVTMTGTLTIASSADGTAVTTTISAPYYGTINVNMGRDMYTLEIYTEEATLIGKTVTVTYGNKTKTAIINADGEAEIVIYGYTGAVTVTASDGEDTAEVSITIVAGTSTYSVLLTFAQIYGVLWDGSSSPSMTRTDAAADFSDPAPQMKSGSSWTAGSSPFDDILPWSGMQIVEDSVAGTLVSIPKYYYKWTKTGSAMTLQISEKSFDGSHVSPAHADRGDGQGERDVVYVGRYHCAPDGKSKTNAQPSTGSSRADFRSFIREPGNLSSDCWQYDFAMYWTIMMLYIVEFANWNSQAMIGYGCSDSGSKQNTGLTDAMTYHTGTNQSSKTDYGHTQYRHIEDLWGNVNDWCDGIRFSGADVYIINNPASFSDTSGGIKVGTRPTASSWIKITSWSIPSVSGFEWALYPSNSSGGSESTYICDYCNYSSSGVVLYVGGDYSRDQGYGAFYLYGGTRASYTSAAVGSRLMKLPNNS